LSLPKWIVEKQRDFVAWWDAGPGSRKSAGLEVNGIRQSDNADRRSLISVEKAEEAMKISQQQASPFDLGYAAAQVPPDSNELKGSVSWYKETEFSGAATRSEQ
jgi:hypothetical protein